MLASRKGGERRTMGGWEDIAERNPEYLAQSDEVVGRDALSRTLISLDKPGFDSQLPGENILAEPQRAALAPDAPADMPIIRRHDRGSN
jgi:hypothetical protein